MKKIMVVLSLFFLLTACQQKEIEPKQAIKKIEQSEIYSIKYEPYKNNENKEIMLTIEKNKKPLLVFYFQGKKKEYNFLILYNYNKKIPIQKYYAIEPQNVEKREIDSYIKYKKELDIQYEKELDELGLTTDELTQLVLYYYISK